MTGAERLLLLLCSDLGQTEARPLRAAQYRLLRERLLSAALPDEELGQRTLQGLGYTAEEARRILTLLARDPEPWLQELEHNGTELLSRLHPDYPVRLREKLGDAAPLLLYSCGERSLLRPAAVSVVGSRAASPAALTLAAELGAWIAARGAVLCSGGAVGVDTAALEACLAAGGSAVLCLPGDMRPTAKKYLRFLQSGRLLLLTAAPAARVHPALALERNRWIHAHGSAVVVCQCEAGKGGSWRGAAENLRNHWSPVFVSSDGSEGCNDLCTRGAMPLDWDALQNVLP